MSNNKYAALFEDQDDIFGGTPSSKFWDIANQASDDLVKNVFDMMFERMAVMEHLLEENNIHIDDRLDRYVLKNSENVETKKKSLYVEYTGEIVCRLDS
jgi:hypothetical protein